MRKNLGWRFALIGVIVLLTLFYIYPTIKWSTLSKDKRAALVEKNRLYDAEHPNPTSSEQIGTYISRWFKGDKSKVLNLGLDLQGGMHLVLEVDSDAAIENELVRIKNDLRKNFVNNHIIVGSMAVENQRIVIPISGTPAADVEKAINDYAGQGTLAVTPTGDKIFISLPADRIESIRTISVKQALETMRNRIDEFGVAEPVIQRQGENHILVQLPGIEDPQRVKDLLGKTAQLSFHIVVEGPAPKEQILSAYNQQLPSNTYLAPLREKRAGQQLYYLLDKEASVTGADLVDARIGQDEMGTPAVNFQLSRSGAVAFERLTEANINKQLAIVLDEEVESAPTIRSRISSNGQISGKFTPQEAEDLAIVLRSGALPAPVHIIEQRTVGPTLGIESIQDGLRAGLLSLLIVGGFMIWYYRASGAIADLALLLNIATLLAFLSYFRATLTLPGIAGIILTIGMAVDANVLVFERIREELEKGKTIRSAIDTGYSRAFLVIFDANLTTLITAVVLFQFGTGPIKGFAVTLSAGILISMFTALFVTRAIFDLLTQKQWLKKINMLRVFGQPHIGFVSKRYFAIGASLIAIIISIVAFSVRGNNNYGIDFTQGTILQVRFEQPITTKDVREALSRGGLGEATVQQYGSPNDILIRTSLDSAKGDQKDEKGTAALVGEKIERILKENVSNNPFQVERTEEVGAAMSTELRDKALLSILYSTLGILIYIWFRFEFRFGLGAVLAVIHDVIITVGVLALTRREIQLPVVAALLTIFGYSVNDTIVVFDRIRENMRLKRGLEFRKLMDLSINETLSRTIITSLTVLFCVFVLYLVGSEVTRDFSFALLFGITVGTYSSIFIASPIVLMWQQLFRRKKSALAQQKAQKKNKVLDNA
jgi:SecD/SecF fusion protein